jgi:hypothetical protein
MKRFNRRTLMKLVSLKSVLFYGVTIVAVMVLFSVTTSYGETHLKAATPIAGSYKFINSDCLNGTSLRLDQSGRYLTAAIVIPNSPIATPPSLSGTWSGTPNPNGTVPLTLSGTIPALPNCYAAQKIWFQGTIENQTFSGELIFAKGDRVPFRSGLEVKVKEERLH